MITLLILIGIITMAVLIYFIWPTDSAYEQMKIRVESEEYKQWLDELHNKDRNDEM